MIRWTLVIALFGLAGLVLFYQSRQQEVAKTGAYQSGYAKAANTQRPLALTIDSLRDSLAKLVDKHQDRDSAYDHLVAVSDSLDQLASEQAATIDSLGRKVRQATYASKTSGGRPAATRPVVSHANILSFYKKRYESLPVDLTPYEHQVAIREIRLETAKKFALSLAEFERIRTAGNLSF